MMVVGVFCVRDGDVPLLKVILITYFDLDKLIISIN